MNKLLTLGLVLGGGYILLKDVFGINLFGTSTPTTPAAPAGPAATTTTQTGSPASPIASNTLTQMLSVLTKANVDPASYQTVDVWNYYYSQVRGIAGPAPEVLFVGVDRNKMYSLQEWWAAMQSAGFNGLGMIAHYVNPYTNPTMNYTNFANRPYQANLRLRFLERMPIVLGQ